MSGLSIYREQNDLILDLGKNKSRAHFDEILSSTLFNIDKRAQGYGGRIIDVFLLSLFQYEIDNISSSLESRCGYNLIDLVLSFSNLHYMKPDLFYPDELKLFMKEITDATK